MKDQRTGRRVGTGRDEDSWVKLAFTLNAPKILQEL